MSTIGISIASFIALLALAVYSLYRERTRAGLFLCSALIVTALLELYDLLALTATADALSWKRYALIAESFLPPLWILCSLTFARKSRPWMIGRVLQIFIALTFLFTVVPFIYPLNEIFYAPDFPGERILFLETVGYYYYLGVTACLVIALVNFEATLSNASPEALSRIKFNIIGLGTILVVLCFYYSHALLYRTLNMSYVPLRSFMYLVAAALIIFSLLHRRGKARIQVSRQVAFKSIVLFAVGIYLVLFGFLGEGMQYFGTSFPRTVSISFAFLIGIALLILLLSEKVRREVKVALHKNFYQQKYDYRTQWLRFSEQLSTSRSGEELLQRILAAYCEIFGIGGAALFLLDEGQGGYSMVAVHEMDMIDDVIARENSLIRFMEDNAWVVNIHDENPDIMAENRPFFIQNRISFIVPLFDGPHIVGFIALGSVINAKEVYIYEDYDLMKTIARQASLAIQHHRLSEQITQAREVEAIGNVATFVVHDLKNQVSNLSLIVENAPKYIQHPDFQKDMLASLGNTVDKMKLLIGRLKSLKENRLFEPRPVNLLELVQKTASTIVGPRVNVSGKAVTACVDDSEIQKVVLNLIMNGIEASDAHDPVTIEVGCEGRPYIRVADDGCGMSAHVIRTELFKPFKTSKSQGLGIGLYQCRQIVAAHGGKIDVQSVVGRGTVFTVWLSNHDDCSEGPNQMPDKE